MSPSRLLEIITALGFELTRRGNATDELQQLRVYYQAVRHGRAAAPGFAFMTGPGETWTHVRVMERMGSLGLLTPARPGGVKGWAQQRLEKTRDSGPKD